MRPGPSNLGPFDPGYADLPQELPIFPLTNALLLPGGRLPLNVFEPRYLAMVRAALQSPDRLIGMVQPIDANADRNLQADHRPAVHQVGCAGRIVSFEETPDGRYQLILSGLIRFRISHELPMAKGGYRRIVPNYQPFAHDMAEHEFQLADRPRFLAILQEYLKTRQARLDWKGIEEVADDELVVAMAQMSPLDPEEKQSLLECPDLDAVVEMMVALFEVHGVTSGGEHRLH
ncbi:LON peptidase substrate-binding domain-containing protein [Dongia sp.]|jgi:Lon protease-like protein|uniref:LON peptidase substrate-binding domain-containing protein n=1 Tax=Dongia sp. TaxID=1977262 RepID=UPI0034A23DEE